MTLTALIRKRDAGDSATAIPAIPATQAEGDRGTVARIATVAVANPREEKTAFLAKVGAGDTATAFRWWLIHYPDRDSLEVVCCPEATHAKILERHPGAVAAEPYNPTIRQPSEPLTTQDEAAIRGWLAQIEETDAATIAEVIGQCLRDADARNYFTGRAAAELPKPDTFPDDRRTCEQCANLIGRRCQAAKRGEVEASRNYEPIRDCPRRCEGYSPKAADPDQRHGTVRWPSLRAIQTTRES